MAKITTRIKKFKQYRMSIEKMSDGNKDDSLNSKSFSLSQEHTSWLMTFVFAIIVTVTIIVFALVLMGSTS
jgi:ribosomal protein L17